MYLATCAEAYHNNSYVSSGILLFCRRYMRTDVVLPIRDASYDLALRQNIFRFFYFQPFQSKLRAEAAKISHVSGEPAKTSFLRFSQVLNHAVGIGRNLLKGKASEFGLSGHLNTLVGDLLNLL